MADDEGDAGPETSGSDSTEDPNDSIPNLEEKVQAYDPVNITKASWQEQEQMAEESGLTEVVHDLLDGSRTLEEAAEKASHLIASSFNIPLFPDPWERRLLEGAISLIFSTLRRTLRD